MKFEEDKNKEAAALHYIFSQYPFLKSKALESVDSNEYFQANVFEQKAYELEGENAVFARLVISLLRQDPFPLFMLNTLSDEQLNVAFEAIRRCKNGRGIYELNDQSMTLREQDAAADPEEPVEILGQTQVADLLQENGVDMDRRKVAVYYQRGHLPTPYIRMGKSPGWKKETIQKWIQDYQNGKIVPRRNR